MATPVPATVTFDPLTATATLTPTGGLIYAKTYTARLHAGASGVTDMSGRSLPPTTRGRSRPSRRRRRSRSSRRRPTRYSAYAGEILRAEGFSFATVDTAFISPTLLGFYDTVVIGDVALTGAQVTTLTNWVAGRRQPDRAAARTSSSRRCSASPTPARRCRTPTSGRHVNAPGSGIVGQTMQFHGTADRYTPQRRDRSRDALLERLHRDREPGRHPPLRRHERRTGGCLHVRPRPLGRPTPARGTRLGRTGARRRRRHPPRRPLLRRARPATSSLTGSTRPRSTSRRPTSNSACSRT